MISKHERTMGPDVRPLRLLAVLTVLLATAVACGGAQASPKSVAPPTPAPTTASVAAVPSATPARQTPKPFAYVPAMIPTQTAELPQPSARPRTSASSQPFAATGASQPSGPPAHDFELTLFDGGTLSLSQLEGKVVVLNFWASWCPPCRWEMPAFERMANEYGEDAVFVGVAISDVESEARGFAEKVGVTYPLGIDYTGEIARAYQVTALPTTFFIDRNGRIARRLANRANEAVLRLFLEGQLGG